MAMHLLHGTNCSAGTTSNETQDNARHRQKKQNIYSYVCADNRPGAQPNTDLSHRV